MSIVSIKGLISTGPSKHDEEDAYVFGDGSKGKYFVGEIRNIRVSHTNAHYRTNN
jgi:hypothetical protein